MKKPTVQRKFVRTPENIAASVNAVCSKAFRRELAECKTWPDWPKKTRNGWPKDEIQSFYFRNAAKMAAFRSLGRVATPDRSGAAISSRGASRPRAVATMP